jgi:2-isopropylmalate synthase
MHRQRDWRTGGKRVLGRNRDGHSDPERSVSFDHRVNTKEIARASRLISKLTGITVQPNKAVVGANAFAHSSGIHQDGVLKSRTTYEIMNPFRRGRGGKRSALDRSFRPQRRPKSAQTFGVYSDGPSVGNVVRQIQNVGGQKKYVFDDDLLALVEEEGRDKAVEAYHLDYLSTTSGTGIVPTATVRLKKEGEVFQEASCGDGPVDAATAPWTKSPG